METDTAPEGDIKTRKILEEEDIPESVELLTDHFRIISYNGGADSKEYEIAKALEDGGIHCSKRGKNFDLLLEFDDTKGFYLAAVVISGSPACSAPLKSALV
ncbi:hypothetical protein AAMO2058_001607600, partial [Amorphochlora amoebiformis]